MTKDQIQAEEKIKKLIVDGHRRGICDREGHSDVRDGMYVPKARVLRGVTFHKTYKRYI